MKPHVLVVEDDYDTRITLAYRLQYAGYRVTHAPDGETAVDLLETDSFDVVLTDIVMGDVNGIEVLHTARLQPYHPAVIILTGHGSLETAIAAVREGAYDYLLKPCEPEKLLNCIAGAIERHHAEQQLSQATTTLFSPRSGHSSRDHTDYQPHLSAHHHGHVGILHVGSLTIGHSRRDVFLGDMPIHVTPIEHSILRCLAETQGNVRGYSDIIRSTHHLDVEDNEAQIMLKTHIRNLRRKLGSNVIETERGIGYKLLPPEEE
jgi:DNA-binding response OmpR family regulator